MTFIFVVFSINYMRNPHTQQDSSTESNVEVLQTFLTATAVTNVTDSRSVPFRCSSKDST